MPQPRAFQTRTEESGETRLRALVTVVPKHVLSQKRVRENARAFFGPRSALFEHLEPVFGNALIETRYACEPFEWYLTEHDFAEKSERYAEHATALALEIATNALDQAGLAAQEIDAIVCVSSTGISRASRLGVMMPVDETQTMASISCAARPAWSS
ncbi:MAG: hypothetical protein NUV72_07960, partial [Bauldia sp.]|nr:hypothetical protein [Bauldia sp.]